MIIEEVKKSETETIEDCDIDVEASTHKLPYDLSKIEGMSSEVISGKTLNDEQKNFCPTSMKLQDQRVTLSVSLTSKLWFLDLDMVDILLNFIKAERTGDWYLHLQ